MKKNSDEPVFEVESPDGWIIRVPESKLEEWSKKQAQNAGQRRELTDFEKRLRDRIVSMVYDSDDTSDPSGASDPPIPTPEPSSPDPEPEYTLKDNTSDPSGPSGTSDFPTPTPEPSSPDPEPEYKLKWDTFVTFVMLPLTILNTASYSLLYLQSDRTDDILFGSVTMFTLLTLVLAVVSFVGLLKRCWYGPCSFAWMIASGLLADLISIPLLLESTSPTTLAGTMAGSFLVRIIIGILTWIYYKRRRPLFAPPPAPKSAHIPTSSEKESAPRLFKVPPFPFYRKKEDLIQPAISPIEPSMKESQKAQQAKTAPSSSSPFFKSIPLQTILLSLSLILLLAISICFAVYANAYRYTQADLDSATQAAESSAYIRGKESNASDLELLKEQRNELLAQQREMLPEYEFFRRNAAIVTKYGERYHHYSCPFVNFDYFYIYNVNAAELRGYTPCLLCWEEGLPD